MRRCSSVDCGVFTESLSVFKFDDDLSSRTMELFVRSWDPGKLYFYQSDVDALNKD